MFYGSTRARVTLKLNFRGISMPMVQYLLLSTFLKKYSSEVSWPILIKFLVKHHHVGGKAAYGLWADWMELWLPW